MVVSLPGCNPTRLDIRAKLQQAQHKMKIVYDKGHRDVEFSPGSYVWLRVSLLKSFKGEVPATPPSLPLVQEGRVVPTPCSVFRSHLNHGNWEILVQWYGLSVEDSTWETVNHFTSAFPDFKLEDKLFLQEGSNVIDAFVGNNTIIGKSRNKNRGLDLSIGPNFSKPPAALGSLPATLSASCAASNIVDMLLHCSLGSSENGSRPKPCPPRPGEKCEMHVVPVQLPLISSLSKLRIFVDLRTLEERQSIFLAVQENAYMQM
ncbi:hypothetical protein KY285_010451 [Solanum tuberosum]|nr:hypothetical protein KY289_011006 [Solanum tuberosum]KAH0734744.1 hypothetical protein KY285_010451 [Solanum tuberosum]